MERRDFVLTSMRSTPSMLLGRADSQEFAPAPCTLNVTDFGATGDGGTDDTAALSAAFAAVPPAGAQVCVPPGTYLVSGLLSLRSRTYLKGAGASSVFKRTGTATDTVFLSHTVNDVTVESIAIDLNGARAQGDAKSFATGIGFRTNCTDLRIRDIRVLDSTGTNVCCRHGILVLESKRVWIERNHLTQGLRLKAGGVGDKVIIEGNVITEANDNAITIATPNVSSLTTNYIIRNNIVEDAMGVYIYVGDDGASAAGLTYDSIIIEGNLLIGQARTAMVLVRLAEVTRRVQIVNNVLLSTSESAYQFSAGIQTTIQTAFGRKGTDFLIANNTVSGPFSHAGIWAQSLDNVRIVNNNVSNVTTGDGVRLTSLQDAVIQGNIITGCGRGIWWTADSFQVTMVGNSITKSTGEGILLSPLSGTALAVSATLLGNNVRDNGGAGVREVTTAPIGTRYLFNDLRGNAGGAINGIGPQGALLGNQGTHDYIRRHISQENDWDPPSLAHAAAVSIVFTVVGARLGDTVAVALSRRLPPRMMLGGAVTGVDQVGVTLLNMSGSSQNIAAGKVRIDVWQH